MATDHNANSRDKEQSAGSRAAVLPSVFNIIGTFGSFFGNLYGMSWRRRTLRLFGRRRSPWGGRLAIVLILLAIISGFATYAALNALPPFGNDPDTVFWLLNLDLIILLLFVTLTASRVVNIWSGRRRGLAGSKLHVRLVLIFSLLTVTPAILMTIFSAFFLHFGVQSWFSDRVRTAIEESQAVAKAYLNEHQQVIRADALAAANDLNRQAEILSENRTALEQIMQTQSMLRNFSETLIFDRSGNVYARTGDTTLAPEELPPYLIEQARKGEIVLIADGDDNRVHALLRLNNFMDSFLLAGRMVDPTVLRHLADIQKASSDYKKLDEQRSNLQITITMIFVIVALLLLFAAIWLGLVLARQIVLPISNMVSASDRVRTGDLTARVPERKRGDEFDILAMSFNKMTEQLYEQREELIIANRQLDQRRRFTETVLAGVSSGIVGVNETGQITLVNSSAAELFQMEAQDITGRNLGDIIPDILPSLNEAYERPRKITQSEIIYSRNDGTRRIFLVRIAIEIIGDEDKGAVLTFDDITELQSAQRKAAWADVARRIAHEIKNPLTPIQLSAERLKRKYLVQIKDDPDTFAQCTDTIINHVGDIGRMVNEFSAFARMPEPVMRKGNILAAVQEVILFQQQAHADMDFETIIISDEKNPEFLSVFDSQQVRQALTNIIQNALDSIQTRMAETPDKGVGRIRIVISPYDKDHDIAIIVSDNGLGLPKDEDISRLTEPYVTHREKGTGLGLAIVKKIAEDHKGRLVMGTPPWLQAIKEWEDIGGATVTLVFPLEPRLSDSAGTGNKEDGQKAA